MADFQKHFRTCSGKKIDLCFKGPHTFSIQNVIIIILFTLLFDKTHNLKIISAYK